MSIRACLSSVILVIFKCLFQLLTGKEVSMTVLITVIFWVSFRFDFLLRPSLSVMGVFGFIFFFVISLYSVLQAMLLQFDVHFWVVLLLEGG